MRPRLIAGVIVLALGIVLLVRGGTFTSRQDVLKVGDIKVTADQRQSIPPWVGGLVVAVGAAILLMGARKQA
ncbi:MAG: hypothetical protein ACKVZ0_22740 [Gemmatimonadales bacterium]